jgi:hypothetical protein
VKKRARVERDEPTLHSMQLFADRTAALLNRPERPMTGLQLMIYMAVKGIGPKPRRKVNAI